VARLQRSPTPGLPCAMTNDIHLLDGGRSAKFKIFPSVDDSGFGFFFFCGARKRSSDQPKSWFCFLQFKMMGKGFLPLDRWWFFAVPGTTTKLIEVFFSFPLSLSLPKKKKSAEPGGICLWRTGFVVADLGDLKGIFAFPTFARVLSQGSSGGPFLRSRRDYKLTGLLVAELIGSSQAG